MNILLIHQAFVTTGEAGGTRHIEFAERLAAAGHKVTIITSPVSYLSGENKLPGAYLWKTEAFAPNIEIRYCFTGAGMHKGFLPRLWAFFTFMISSFFCSLNVKDPDIIWGTSPNIFQAWTAWCCHFVRRKPFVLEIRDLWPAFAVAMGALKNKLLISLSRGLEKFLYRHADQIIVNSPGFIDHIRGISGKTPILIPNGADAEMFAESDNGAAFRERCGLGDDFVVMYCGAHGPANDLGTALAAAALLKDTPGIRFVFVGSGKDKPRLEAVKAEQGLDNVLFMSSVSKDGIADVMAASDAGLAILKDIEMFRTTYPNKVFDIMACGRPVLCQIDGVIRDVIEEADCGLFIRPGDPRALADAVLELRSDPDRCRQMGSNGIQAVREKYSRDIAAKQLESVFKSMVKQERAK